MSVLGHFIGVLGLEGHNGPAAVHCDSPSRLDEKIPPPEMGDLSLPMDNGARRSLPRGREEPKTAWAQYQCLAGLSERCAFGIRKSKHIARI